MFNWSGVNPVCQRSLFCRTFEHNHYEFQVRKVSCLFQKAVANVCTSTGAIRISKFLLTIPGQLVSTGTISFLPSQTKKQGALTSLKGVKIS